MIRIISWSSALLLCGCTSPPAHVDVTGCCYPGARIALARMPSTGDVAINLGTIEHVLISRTDPSELEAVTPRPSNNRTAITSRTTSTATSPGSTPRFDTAPRREADVDTSPGDAPWIDFVNASHLGSTTERESCPTDVVVRRDQ